MRETHLVARALAAFGLVLLATCYATLARRLLGVLPQRHGLAEIGAVIADLTVSLWIASAVLILGAAVSAVLPRRG
jgi:hypothetical protein